MKNLLNKGGQLKDLQATSQVGDVQIWYQHNLNEDKIFYQKAESTEAARQQLAVIYKLMRFMKENNLIADYDANNSGGFTVMGADNKNIRTVVRDESDEKSSMATEPKEDDLRLWYVHQFGTENIFYSQVSRPEEAMAMLDIIYDLTLFLYENNQIPDYCNAGGLEFYEADSEDGFEWCEWCNQNGLDVGEIMAIHMECDE